MSINRCYIKVSNPSTLATDHASATAEVRNILGSTYGPDFMFEDDTRVREMFIKHEVVENFNNPDTGWNNIEKSFNIQYESLKDLTEFMDEYFNHEFFIKYKLALEGQGWSVSAPTTSIE
jgi:hypothetical protein